MATTSSVSNSNLLDVPSLVSQLMAVERRPIDKLNTQVSAYQSQISTFGQISSMVSTLKSAFQTLTTALQGYSATASDSSLFSAVADSTAAAGNYSVTVSQLARAQTLAAAGIDSATTAIGGSSPSTLTLTINGVDHAINIGASASLSDIRDAINAAGIGVTAGIVNDGTAHPYRLTITANSTGTANAVTKMVASDGAIDTLMNFGTAQASTVTEAQPAANASVKVNGIPITSASNVISGAIQGVTLTLKSESATAGNLTVARDTASVETAVNGFVSAYNTLYSELKSVSTYATASGATQPLLAGDGTVRMMMDQMSSVLTTAATGGTYSFMSQVGISAQADGTLAVDSSTLETTLNSHFADFSSLFTSTTGFATRFTSLASSLLGVGGLINQHTQTLNDSISTLDDNIAQLERRMTVLQQQYLITYSNLNMYLSQADSTSAYLTAQFSKNSSSS